MKKSKRLILIDLDGVLNTYDGVFCENYIPPIRKGAKKFLINLSKNYIIKLFTTRNNLLASKWVIENDLDNYITDVTNIKENCFVHIDDKCIKFLGDFPRLQKDIENFQVWFKHIS